MIGREDTPVAQPVVKTGWSAEIGGRGAAGRLLVRVLPLLAACAMILVPVRSLAQGKDARIALVIGNAAYSGIDGLKNPVNDAQDIAAELRKLGFSVIERTNLDLPAMQTALGDFYRRLAGAPKALALVYFAGHGSMEGSRNYLWPIGMEKQPHISDHAPYLEEILGQMQSELYGHTGPRVAIIDACRENSRISNRGRDARGLAMKASAGTLIALAASPGQTATDNPSGRNGLYTKHLLERLRAERGSLRDVFDDAGKAVVGETGGTQIPLVLLVAGADMEIFRKPLWPGDSSDVQTAEKQRLGLELESKRAEISALEERIKMRRQTVDEAAKNPLQPFHTPSLPKGRNLCTSNIRLVAFDSELLNTGVELLAHVVDTDPKNRGIHLPNVYSYSYREFARINQAVEPLPGTYVGSTASGDSVTLTVQAGPTLTEFQTSLNVQTHSGTFNVVPLYREMDACPFESGLVAAFLPNKGGHAFLIVQAHARQEIAGYLLARANLQEEIVLLQFRANRVGR